MAANTTSPTDPAALASAPTMAANETPAAPIGYVLHTGVGAEDYTLVLDRDCPPARALGEQVVLWAGRADLSHYRLRERLGRTLRVGGRAGEHEAVDLGRLRIEPVLVDELIHLAGSHDNVVRPLAGRRRGLMLPRSVLREVVRIGGPYLGDRLDPALSGSTSDGASAPPVSERTSATDIGPQLAASPSSARRDAVGRAMDALPYRRRERPLVVGAALTAIAVIATVVSERGKIVAGAVPDGLPIALAVILMVGICMTTLVQIEIGPSRRAAIEATLPPFTERFRDARTGRFGIYLGTRTMTCVRWTNEPDRVEQLWPDAVEHLERFAPDLIVDRSAGRGGRIEDTVERACVRWDGESADTALELARRGDLVPMVAQR